MIDNTLILRIALAIILLSHGLPGMFDGGVNAFGNSFLNQVGFSPLGVPLAWAIKISHVLCAILLIVNKYIKPVSIVTILILLMGIIMVHASEGWFVVGGGRNGVEYNFLLICVFLYLMFPKGLKLKS
ncbi:DoxX family protein [Chryseotalea sanaruensis]|uniref:DoxX family protein n=1 Tax=Chryseotalea sanaruensis TaxID=2482724 RepID=A0A401U6B1_9BACT|nr:DoxX family protein [Chryseotalea sanaruensis]GCC50461.1 DoxX family protein [Chryseotalea sanaruensis]